jgi:FkbM family methyltransferase
MNPRTLLKRFLVRRLGVPDMRAALLHLKRNGVAPSAVYDVGAYQGDFARLALEIWPAARVHCFEVLPGPLERLQALQRAQPRIEIHRVLLGAAPHEQVMLHEAETASSILEEHVPNRFARHGYPMRTLDAFATAPGGAAPSGLLKIDVQGYELEVLKGAAGTLPALAAAVVEVNLLDIHKGVPLVAEVAAWFERQVWAFYDIAGLTRRPLDGALWQLDAVFVPAAGPLRADKRWE